MEIYYEFHHFVEFWNMWHKKFKENIFMEIDFTSLSCLKNQRNQNWICQLLRLSHVQHTHKWVKKTAKLLNRSSLEFLGLSCQYHVRFARLWETRVTFVITMFGDGRTASRTRTQGENVKFEDLLTAFNWFLPLYQEEKFPEQEQ